MKRLASFWLTVFSFLALSAGSRAFSQASLWSYGMERDTVAATHVYSSATTLNIAAGDTLNNLWLQSGDIHIELAELADMRDTPAEQTGFEIGFDFPFGRKTMTHFGLTGGGFVFFSEDATFTPAVELQWQNQMVEVQDYIYFELKALSSSFYGYYYTWMDPSIAVAGQDAKVQYEVATQAGSTGGEVDTLFVRYDNLLIYDKFGTDSLKVSFEYAFMENGEFSFTVISMENGETESDEETGANFFGFSFGAYASSLDEAIFLQDDYATAESGTIGTMVVTSEEAPVSGLRYRFSLPETCQVVSGVTMREWDVEVAATSIEFTSNTEWYGTDATKALFILSEDSVLKGGNLPVDGTAYASGDVIGTSAGVKLAEYSPYGYTFFEDGGEIAGLKPMTTYYAHVFPYNDACAGGPLYNFNEILRDTITTLMPAPSSAEVLSFGLDSIALAIEAFQDCHYLLAWSPTQIDASGDLSIDPREEAFVAGDSIEFYSYGSGYTYLYVLEPNSEEKQVVLNDLSSGTDYYFYVWSTNPEGTQFSSEALSVSAATEYELTAEIDFESASGSSQDVAGWTFDQENDYEFFVTEDETMGKMLVVQSTTAMDESFEQVTSTSMAVSPVINKGDYDSVAPIIDFYFYTSSWMSNSPSRPQQGDTVFIQYKNTDAGEWTDLAFVTQGAEVASNGTFRFEAPAFGPGATHQLRFIVRSSVVPGASGALYVGIRKITVEPLLSCKKVENLAIDEEALSFNAAALVWEDANRPFAEAFQVRYRKSGSEQWQAPVYAQETRMELSSLDTNAAYVAEIRSVCGANDTSLAREIEFSTFSTLPYVFELVQEGYSSALPADLEIKTGVLTDEAVDFAELSDPELEKFSWAVVPTSDYSGEYLGITSIAESYMGPNVNNPMWLKFPTLAVGDQQGTARISMSLSGRMLDYYYESHDPQFTEKDQFKVLVSTDGKFSTASVVDSIDLSLLRLDTVKDFFFDIPVDGPAKLYVALYTNFNIEDKIESESEHSLWVNAFGIDWESFFCPAVTNIRQSNLTKTSVDISWSGESLEYAVIYKPRAVEVIPDTLYTEESSCTLDSLTPGTAYEYFIVGYCEPGRLNPSEPSETRYFNTVAECLVPTIEVIDGSVTWQSATFAMSSEEKTRMLNIYAQNLTAYPGINYFIDTERDTLTVTGLYAAINIPYYARVRAICAVGDSSAWSEPVSFTTLPLPACGTPTGLDSKVDLEARTATLSWTNGENNQYQLLMHKTAEAPVFDSVGAEGTSYTIYDLTLNTTYVWRLRGVCEDGLLVSEIAESDFSTKESAIESVNGFNGLKVRVSNNQIIVENPDNLYLKAIEVFAADGKLQRTYPVNSSENVFIYHDLQKGMALIRVIGADDETATYKAVIL